MEISMSSRLKLITKVVGAISTNCYILVNNDTKEAVIVDPGADEPAISQVISDNNVKPVAVLLTHGHFDHILAVDKIRTKYGIPVYMGADEQNLAADAALNLSADFGCTCTVKAEHLVHDRDDIELAGFTFHVIATPGHTEGSVCYYLSDEGILLSGDTLFCEGMGRTDLPTGSSRKLMESIANRLMTLPDETNVYPGHGEETQIGWEKSNR
ncbi:MAG: MBL fold metallo-hydrolase [Clostridia bacterium]|nr:MBL fold metallo-hydrolase [Clostridia bacterium]